MKIFLSSVVAAIILISCSRKDNEFVEAPEYSGEAQVSFNNYVDQGINGYAIREVSIADSFINMNVEVKLVNTTATAKNDIKVYLTKNDAAIADVNPALTPLSLNAAAVKFDISQPVIIKKGQRSASINLFINPSKLDLSKSNAIGLGIFKVEGAGVQNSFNTNVVVEIITRNKYDGKYILKAGTFHPTNATLAGPVGPYADWELITTGANSVIFYDTHPWANGSNSATPAGYEPTFTVNPGTNAVTVTADPSLGVINNPTYNSRYVPASGGGGTFYVSWQYAGSGGNRVFTDTLIYTGPR